LNFKEKFATKKVRKMMNILKLVGNILLEIKEESIYFRNIEKKF
jgi:hypothetical protein